MRARQPQIDSSAIRIIQSDVPPQLSRYTRPLSRTRRNMAVPLATISPYPSKPSHNLPGSPRPVPVAPSLCDNLVLREEQGGRSEEKDTPQDEKGCTFVLSLRQLASFVVAPFVTSGGGAVTLAREEEKTLVRMEARAAIYGPWRAVAGTTCGCSM